jgi:hypothetical protein
MAPYSFSIVNSGRCSANSTILLAVGKSLLENRVAAFDTNNLKTVLFHCST